MEEYILEGKDISSMNRLEKHAEWVKKFLPKYPESQKKHPWYSFRKRLESDTHVLEDAGEHNVRLREDGIHAFS